MRTRRDREFLEPADVLAGYDEQTGEIRPTDYDGIRVDVHGNVAVLAASPAAGRGLRNCATPAFGYEGDVLAEKPPRAVIIIHVLPLNQWVDIDKLHRGYRSSGTYIVILQPYRNHEIPTWNLVKRQLQTADPAYQGRSCSPPNGHATTTTTLWRRPGARRRGTIPELGPATLNQAYQFPLRWIPED